VEKFKGETTPNEFKFIKQFLGETNPTKSNLSAQFLGETNTTNITQGDKFKGETDPTLITYDPNLEKQGKDPKYVDFFSNEDAWGFSPLQKHKSPSKFRGVNPTQTNFDGTTSLYGLNTPVEYNGSKLNSVFKDKSSVDGDMTKVVEGTSFSPGYGKYRLKGDTGTTLRYNFDKRYDETYKSIGQLMEQRFSPSFLDEMYAKYNLKDDSPNQLNLIKAPYILRGIQRKKITKGEPQFWDFGLGIDDGFIRGGIVTSTARAIADVLRVGSFFLSVKGLLWGVKQFGMQRTNTYGKLWTPINLLANVTTQHIGLKWDRPGIIPIGDESWKYGFKMGAIKVAEKAGKIAGLLAQKSTEVEGISYLYNNKLKLGVGRTLKEQKGGPDSFYGIGKTFTTQYVDTFQNDGKDWGDSQAGRAVDVGGGSPSWKPFEQKYDPFKLRGFKTYSEDLPDDKNGNLVSQTQQNSPIPIDTANEGKPTNGVAPSSLENKTDLLKSEGFYRGSSDIRDYEAISYGKIAKRAEEWVGFTGATDFRELYGDDNPKNILNDKYSYTNQGRHKYRMAGIQTEKIQKYLFGKDSVTNQQSGDFVNKSIYAGLDGDKLSLVDDFIPLYFGWDDTSGNHRKQFTIQFRATVNGISETFSPSWNGIKYPGRADKSYMYEEFERTLSFNFKVYAESRGDMKNMWGKLNELSLMTYPVHSGGTYTGTICYFRLGDLYGNDTDGVPSLITSLTYTIPDDMSWELNQDNELFKVPMGIDVTISLTLLPTHGYYDKSTNEYGFYGKDEQLLRQRTDAEEAEKRKEAAAAKAAKKKTTSTGTSQGSAGGTTIGKSVAPSTPPTPAPSASPSSNTIGDASTKAQKDIDTKAAAKKEARRQTRYDGLYTPGKI
jgi:hypothetical protein